MMLQMVRQDVTANNLANVSSSGYKKDNIIAGAFSEMLLNRWGENQEIGGRIVKKPAAKIGRIGTGAGVVDIFTDFSIGNLTKTDNSTDLAIGKPDGYFAVETPEGEKFTRSGEFKLDYDGLLTTNQGYPVLDYYNNYIYIDGEFTVDSAGNIILDGEPVTRLRIVGFENPRNLTKSGDNLFSSDEEGFLLENPEIVQGYVEKSNVNAVKEMVTLISVVRAYESLQKVVQAEDETVKVAVDQVGSVL